MAAAFMGYVLPWGQMSFWAASVITGLLSAIPENVWHKGVNDSNDPAHIIEVWKGANLTEEDIERWD